MFKEFRREPPGGRLGSEVSLHSKEGKEPHREEAVCETLQEDGSALALLTEKVPAKVCAD